MSLQTTWGYTDSVTTKKNLALPDLSFATDYSVVANGATSCEVVNKTSPLDQMETVRWSYRNIADVYKNTSIDPSAYSPSRKGIAVNVSVRDIVRTIDSADVQYRVDMPATMSLTLTIPQSSLLTTQSLLDFVSRGVAAMFDTGSVTGNRIAALARGAMKPTGL